MLKVADYSKIRRAHRDGMTIREIARTFHHSRRKIRQVLCEAQPKPYTRTREPVSRKLDPLKPIINQILCDDEQAPRKQRHTAAQITRRLVREHGFTGSYDIVRRYVQCRRTDHRETFIPLSHDPGQRLEADFGHIHVDFPEGRRLTPVLICTWSHSNYPFAIAMPTERIEAVLSGMVSAFNFFGCVPAEVWWDNPKTVVKELFSGRQRAISDDYSALSSHYTFDPLFCMPARGNEKPRVENRVYDLQRRWATPVPKVTSFDELNDYLQNMCRSELSRTVAGQTATIGERFQADLKAAQPLPPKPYDPAVYRLAKADKYQTVPFDGNRYSVPRRFAFEQLTVKAYPHTIAIICQGSVIAEHQRSYGHREQILDFMHYLAILSRRPAALDHAPIFKRLPLPAIFDDLRQKLEHHHGRSAGARHFIRVLQLLPNYQVAQLKEAISLSLQKGVPDAETIRLRAERLSMRNRPTPSDDLEGLHVLPIVVPPPDLTRFNLLLTQGENYHVGEQHTAVEEQPAAVTAASHFGGVQQACA